MSGEPSAPFVRGCDRPCVYAKDGFVAVFIGGGYKRLTPDVAEKLAREIDEAARLAREQTA